MTLFKNATLVEFDPPRVREGMDVLVEGDVITEVGRCLTITGPSGPGPAGSGKTVDVSGKILFPGLVCSHHHIYSGLARGILAEIGPTPDFVSILRNLWWRLDRAIDAASLSSSGLICSIDAIRAGTTAVIDHHASPFAIKGSLNLIAEAFEKITGSESGTNTGALVLLWRPSVWTCAQAGDTEAA